MQNIKIKCPAKINLNLKITGRRDDGFHNIESIMQTVDLYDYLTVEAEISDKNEIFLCGNSDKIPYDNSNLVYKAGELFYKNVDLPPQKVKIFIDKNIPVCAGLAGGSTDAAGILFGLNNLYGFPLSEAELHKLCAQLGSDLNVCLKGGRVLAKGRGEIIEEQDFEPFTVNLIKPENLGISAKEAYQTFAHKIKNNIDNDKRINFKNDLEWAIIDKYPELLHIKTKYPSANMTGSGSVYFSLSEEFEKENGYWVQNNVNATASGVTVVS